MKRFSPYSFVAGVMAGVFLAGAWFFGNAVSPVLPMPVQSVVEKPLPKNGAVSVADQPAGSSVIVESVTVPPPGVWVTVRELNGTDLGNVLGAARVAGPRSSVIVSLLRATEPGFPYAIELYRDDGGGTFDLSADSVYVDFATGAPVIARFTTTK